MTSAALQLSVPDVTPAPRDQDQIVVLYGVDWKTYAAMRELLDDAGIRMTYLEGSLEIMSPSPEHEDYKTSIARLIELFALERDVHLNGYGSTTFRKEAKERGLEPDECYVVNRTLDKVPDIALEIIVTSGGINKLAVYEGLGVQEVWFFKERRFELYDLGPQGYAPMSASRLVPGLDFEELALLAQEPDQHEALKKFRDRLRG